MASPFRRRSLCKTEPIIFARGATGRSIGYGTMRGRSKEWHCFERGYVEDACSTCPAEENCALLSDQHKGMRYYGLIAKWVPPGLRRAFLVYCQMAGKTSSKFLEPTERGRRDHFDLAVGLLAWGHRYAPHRTQPRINLLRKGWHSTLLQMSREGKLLSMFKAIDAHSEQMALDTYCVGGAKDAVFNSLPIVSQGSMMCKHFLTGSF